MQTNKLACLCAGCNTPKWTSRNIYNNNNCNIDDHSEEKIMQLSNLLTKIHENTTANLTNGITKSGPIIDKHFLVYSGTA